jgi:hypothetical protein
MVTNGWCIALHCIAWRTLLTWKAKCMLEFDQNHLVILASGSVQIVVKKHLQENPLTSSTNHLLKLVEFVIRRIQADDQMTKLQSVFVRRFSLVRGNPQGGKADSGDVSHLTVWRVLCKRLSFRPYKLQPLHKLQPNVRPRQRDFCTYMLNRL